jgi:hypothetical protein
MEVAHHIQQTGENEGTLYKMVGQTLLALEIQTAEMTGRVVKKRNRRRKTTGNER